MELSVATLANWAAKTANWLVEEVELEPGDRVAVNLPAHWQTAGILLGAWWCGAHVVDETDGARIAFVAPECQIPSGTPAAIVSLDPLGRGLSPLPKNMSTHELSGNEIDFLTEVRTAGDDFSPPLPVPGDTPALLSSTVDELVLSARTAAEAARISNHDRVLSTMEWNFPEGITRTLLATLSAGAHLVQVSHCDTEKLAACRLSERTTIELN